MYVMFALAFCSSILDFFLFLKPGHVIFMEYIFGTGLNSNSPKSVVQFCSMWNCLLSGDMYSEENLSAKDNPAERINEWSDEMELEPGSTVMAGASSSGGDTAHETNSLHCRICVMSALDFCLDILLLTTPSL